jgi:hypothetical protein
MAVARTRSSDVFDYELWLVLPTFALAAAVLAFVAGHRSLAVFVGSFVIASVLGSAWVIWSNPSLEITQDSGVNPIVRLVSSSALVLAALTPLVLERAWSGARLVASASTRRPAVGARRSAVAWAIIVVAVLSYPGSMAVGYSGFRLPGGAPLFPSPNECVREPVEGAKVRVVFGYEESYLDAFELRDRALAAGLEGAEISQDGCGRLRVFVDDLDSIEVGEQVAARARAQQLDAVLERDTDGLSYGRRAAPSAIVSA